MIQRKRGRRKKGAGGMEKGQTRTGRRRERRDRSVDREKAESMSSKMRARRETWKRS